MAYHPPVRRCAPCDTDWPNITLYNLCPRCQRNTHASTAVDDTPDYPAAAKLAAHYKKVREFDAECDAKAAADLAAWAADMNATWGVRPTPTNYGLAGNPPADAQDVRFKPPTPDEIGGWGA